MGPISDLNSPNIDRIMAEFVTLMAEIAMVAFVTLMAPLMIYRAQFVTLRAPLVILMALFVILTAIIDLFSLLMTWKAR